MPEKLREDRQAEEMVALGLITLFFSGFTFFLLVRLTQAKITLRILILNATKNGQMSYYHTQL